MLVGEEDSSGERSSHTQTGGLEDPRDRHLGTTLGRANGPYGAGALTSAEQRSPQLAWQEMRGPRRKAGDLGLGRRTRGAHAAHLGEGSDGQFCADPRRRRVGSPGWVQTPGPGAAPGCRGRRGAGRRRSGRTGPGAAPRGLPSGAPGRAQARVRGTRRQLTCGAPGGTRSAAARRAGGRASAAPHLGIARPLRLSHPRGVEPDPEARRGRGRAPVAGANKPPRGRPAGAHWLQPEAPPRGPAPPRGLEEGLAGAAGRRASAGDGGGRGGRGGGRFRSSAPAPGPSPSPGAWP